VLNTEYSVQQYKPKCSKSKKWKRWNFPHHKFEG